MSETSLEQEIRLYCVQTNIVFTDYTASYKRLDFGLKLGREQFFLEAKEKQKPYTAAHWPEFASEPDLFIVDDLTVRKCLAYAPRAGILVRDGVRSRYVFFSVIDLAMMPKVRVNRRIQRNSDDLKGKWLIHFDNGRAAPTIDAAFTNIRSYLDALPEILFQVHQCYGDYTDEHIQQAGVTRTAGYWVEDVRSTR